MLAHFLRRYLGSNSTTSGTPGGSADIQVRSDNNLSVGSNPLVIVDGVIIEGGLGDINTDDIESIEVVKGAAASALYGSRAGNGVVVVSTKRGAGLSDGDVNVTIRQEVGFQTLDKFIDLAEHHAFALADDWESESTLLSMLVLFILQVIWGVMILILLDLELPKIINTWTTHLQ